MDQVLTMEENVRDFGLTYFGITNRRQDIVHIIGTEQSFSLPGTTCVYGSATQLHTASWGA